MYKEYSWDLKSMPSYEGRYELQSNVDLWEKEVPDEWDH